MAYWQKKRGKVQVFHYDKSKGRPVVLPREETSPLDDKTDAEIERWVRQWEADNGIVRQNRGRRKETVNLPPALEKFFKDYQSERSKEEGVGALQLRNERVHFTKHILKYFVELHGKNDVLRWADVGAGFRGWLTETTEMGPKSKKAVVLTLNRFGRYLKDVGKLKEPWNFKTPKLGHRRTTRTTPLPRPVAPDEVLKAAKALKVKHPNWALALLVGYFASLRPEETFALQRSDFLTGDSAVRHSQTYTRLRKKKLGTRLAIHITKALIDGTEIGPPKNYNSNGVVTVWSVKGAEAIAEILRYWPAKTAFFEHTKSYLFKTYRDDAKPPLGVTLHDLRRASALYLGREIGVEPFLLQDMLRHADLETTMLYTRRPNPDEDLLSGQQDFDDVI